MAREYLELVVDESLLNQKLEYLETAQYFSQITTAQWNRLIQSVYIRSESKITNHCLIVYIDMLELSDIIQLH